MYEKNCEHNNPNPDTTGRDKKKTGKAVVFFR